MHLPSPSLFRAYDVRGIVEKDLRAEDFIQIGHAFASQVSDACSCRTPVIVAMRDARLSSPNLMEAMIEGMLKAGAHVLDGGEGPTPLCYFATHHLDADGGVMITGSHNPPDHNGAKFVVDGLSLHGEALAGLRTRIAQNQLLHSRGHREEIDLLDEYVFELKRALGESNALDNIVIAWDAGNGAAGPIVDALLNGTARTHHRLYTTPDGTFPNHHPDPADLKNLADLQHVVTSDSSCAFGVAFDGDGDRLGVVDDLGRPVAPDHLLMLLADDVLKRKRNVTIIGDVKTSDMFFERVAAKGGTSLMWKTGHALIKSKMRETGAAFAGEASGHLFFADEYYGYDDGMYAAMRVARIVAESGKKLSTLIKALPKLHASAEFRIPCADEKKFAIITELAKAYADKNANTLDGVRVSTDKGWWLLRASNTQAALVGRCEGKTEAATKALTDNLRTILLPYGIAF